MNPERIINSSTNAGHNKTSFNMKGSDYINHCIFCQKPLTSQQISKKNITCGRSCAIEYKKYLKQKQEPDFFLTENKHDLYYLLGLLFTDGNLNQEETRITLSLTEEDVIRDLYPIFSSNCRKIYKYKPKSENANIIYTILNESYEAISKLKEIGYRPCNSISKPYPNIESKYFGDFLRGIFDGDGCVYISNTHKGKKYFAISITGASKEFILQLKEHLELYNFHPTIVIDSRRKNNEIKTFYLKLNRQKEIKQFYELIYENSNIKNQTKYRKFCYGDIV